MRKKIDCLLQSGNNKFGVTLKSCFYGQFCLSQMNGQNFIHIYFEGKEVLVLHCYKNPYWIARYILNKNVLKHVEQIKGYLAQGLYEGLDFTITEKGIALREEWVNKS